MSGNFMLYIKKKKGVEIIAVDRAFALLKT